MEVHGCGGWQFLGVGNAVALPDGVLELIVQHCRLEAFVLKGRSVVCQMLALCGETYQTPVVHLGALRTHP